MTSLLSTLAAARVVAMATGKKAYSAPRATLELLPTPRVAAKTGYSTIRGTALTVVRTGS